MKLASNALIVSGLLGVLLAPPAGYSSQGDVSPSSNTRHCLAATGLHDGDVLFEEPCLHNDAMEQWTAIQVGGVLIEFCLTGHPLWCVAGTPAADGRAAIYETTPNEPDFRQGLTIKGPGLFGSTIGLLSLIRNVHGQYLSGQGGVSAILWARKGAKIRRFKLVQTWIFTDGWTKHTP